MAGDADALDTQSSRLANEWQAIVVSVNYKTADVEPISYGVDEICDVVSYFRDNASKLGADPSRFSIMGYSAGAYYSAEAAEKLARSGQMVEALVLCYPWTTGLPTQDLKGPLPRTMFVLAGKDPISQMEKQYLQSVKYAGISVTEVEYASAVHSFIESNNPEEESDPSSKESGVTSPEREELARQAESAIGKWLGYE